MGFEPLPPLPEGRPIGKLGAVPHDRKLSDLMLADFKTADLPYAKVGYGHTSWEPRRGWGMFGNDQYGDCVCAGAVHETMIWLHSGGQTPNFGDPKSALDMYHDVTGWNPGPDDGTDPVTAAGYRRKTGVADSAGVRHKIGAYLGLETGDWLETLQALYAFEVVGWCFAVPESAMEQFSQGLPWSYKGDTNIVGYHYVPIVGRPRIGMLNAVSWGSVQPMTSAFFRRQAVGGSLAYVSTEMLKGGKSPEGLDVSALNSTLAKLAA